MTSQEKLIDALEEAHAPLDMVQKAERGDYDDYRSPSPTPILDLVRDCWRAGLQSIARQAMNGEYDGTLEEGEAWFKSRQARS